MSMIFDYNNISLRVLSVQNYNRETIYDGPDRLYVRHTVHIRGVYSPAATSYKLPGLGAPPVETTDELNSATITDVAVRNRLMAPRKQLYWSIAFGDINYLLISPLPKNRMAPKGDHFTTDANNGPKPISCDVTKITGTKTFLVDFTIQTDLSECDLEETLPGTVLSHRWSMSDQIDEQFLTTRTIQGQIIFNTSILLDQNQIPDNYRRMIAHPVGPNMRRVWANVQVHEDGHSLHYVVIDREQVFNLSTQAQGMGAVKVEADHLATLVKPQSAEEDALAIARAQLNLANAALSAVESVGQSALTVGSVVAGGGLGAALKSPLAGFQFGGVQQLAGAATGPVRGLLGLAGAVTDSVGTLFAIAPRISHRINAKVWGSRTSTRKGLQAVAFAVIINRINQLQTGLPGVFLSAVNYSVYHRLTDEYVEITLNFTTGPIQSLGLLAQEVAAGGEFRLVPSEEEVAGVLTKAEVANPNLPNDGGTRGTFVRKLLTAALLHPCENIDNQLPPPAPA